MVGQEEVALEVLAEAQELEALEVPEVLAEAEEEVAVLEVIRNNYFKAWFNYPNLGPCHVVFQKSGFQHGRSL